MVRTKSKPKNWFNIIFYSRPWDNTRDLSESVQEIYSFFVNGFEQNKL